MGTLNVSLSIRGARVLPILGSERKLLFRQISPASLVTSKWIIHSSTLRTEIIMKRLDSAGCAPTLSSRAELSEVGPTLGRPAELCITRRKALTLIAGAVPASLLLQGCSSSSSSSTPTPTPTPTPNPTQARPRYHLTPASAWINDPQRPLWINNAWNLWVLWNADYPSGNGTAWRRYTSSDLVNWADQGVSIPKYTTTYGDVWTGSSVVDTNNSAGYGAGAVIAIMTMPCNSLGGQGSGLWYSTNAGQSFQFGSIVQTNPLAGNTAISDLGVSRSVHLLACPNEPVGDEHCRSWQAQRVLVGRSEELGIRERYGSHRPGDFGVSSFVPTPLV